ncbi:MAG: uracil-DNA glycosylase family protein [Pseudomonadota bacterium]
MTSLPPSGTSSSATAPDLDVLVERIRACRLCAERFSETRTAHSPRPVLQTSQTARLCLAGQAPGTRVHASGLPFDDPSGDRLRHWLGVDRATFYDPAKLAIVPMGFCFPGLDAKGGDLPPPQLCAETWRAAVLAQMPQIELIVVIGQYAKAWHLPAERKRSLTTTVADWRFLLEEESSPRVFPIPHPSWRNTAWLKKHPWFEAEAVPALQREVAALL